MLVVPYINMNPPQVYTCSHPEPSSLPIPSLWVVPVHQPQASSIVHRTWTGKFYQKIYFTKILSAVLFIKILIKIWPLKFSNKIIHKTHMKYLKNKSTKVELSFLVACRLIAWKIPWTEEPGTLQSMGSLRVEHNWATSLSLFPFMHWRRKWQPTPVFLPGESPGWGGLVGCRLWSHTESDTTEAT